MKKRMTLLLVFILLFTVACSTEQEDKINESKESNTETRIYDGSYKVSGEGVLELGLGEIVVDLNVDLEEWTEVVVGEAGLDFDGNELTPGVYEFKYVEFPEGTGSWYVYVEDKTLNGNPNATTNGSGTIVELATGDVITINNASVATFYRIAE